MGYNIAVFPGDGVGPELINEGIKIIDKAAELDKFEVKWAKYPHGAEHYTKAGEALTEKALKEIKNSCNAIYCGTFDISNEQKIPKLIRDYFGQFISLRPVKLLPNVESPIANKTNDEIDFTVIRECTEDFYAGASGRAKNGKNRHKIDIDKGACKIRMTMDVESKGNEIAYQIGFLSRKGCERVIKYGFEYAKRKNINKITSIDKANVIEAYSFWRENFEKVAKEYQGIDYEFNLIDAAVVNLIKQPEKYKVIIAPNMFGDILSDLGAALQGFGFACRGSINPEGISMFEPVHSSAPKLKEQGIVNPIATIWAGALLLDSIGQHKSGELIMKAVESVLKEGRTMTHDLSGNNSTAEMGDAILDRLIEMHE